MTKDNITEDVKFLLSFAPATHVKDVHPGLMPMFYISGSYEGDRALVQRIQDIVERYEIDVNTIEDLTEEEN